MTLVEMHGRKTRELVAVDPRRVLMIAEISDRGVIPYRPEGTLVVLEHGREVEVLESYSKVLALLLVEHAE